MCARVFGGSGWGKIPIKKHWCTSAVRDLSIPESVSLLSPRTDVLREFHAHLMRAHREKRQLQIQQEQIQQTLDGIEEQHSAQISKLEKDHTAVVLQVWQISAVSFKLYGQLMFG